MGHPRRMPVHKGVYFVTSRVSEGLPFVPNAFINLILYGILARAQKLTPSISICAWLFLSNHYHAVLVLRGDPSDLAKFMNYVDGEIAKALCRLLGKHHCKVWAQRYNSAQLLNPEAVLKQLTYLYTNPVVAGLVESAHNWFGVSTFEPELTPHTKRYKYVPPSSLPKLKNKPFSGAEIRQLLTKHEEAEGPHASLFVDPLNWIDCFAEVLDPEFARRELLSKIAAVEKAEKKKRLAAKRTVPEPKELARQNPHTHYKPKKYGRRVFCISTNKELRTEFIALYKAFCETCTAVWKAWLSGDFSAVLPPGAFQPPRVPTSHIMARAPGS